MLTTFFGPLLFLYLFISHNYFVFLIPLLGFWLIFLTLTTTSFNQPMCYDGISDELSLFMAFMTVFVLFTSYVYAISFKSFVKLNYVFVFMLLFCLGVFTTNNMFLLYFFYECSLFPILYIIIKWGSYPERSLSAMMLLIYTAIFTFPFMMIMFYVYHLNSSLLITGVMLSSSEPLSELASLIIFLAFAVKLPMYGLHFWLPMAHVEAPTFGSMILAGVLLKLGGVGLVRCSLMMDVSFLSDHFLSYLMVFMVYVTIVCTLQSDFKRLVAYSSVSHMMAVPLLLLANNLLSSKGILMLMLFHGLSSPILFMLVGIVYSMFSTRQLIMIRGFTLISPLLAFTLILAFFFTLSAPPFPSFVAEVTVLVSSFHLTPHLVYAFGAFIFLSLVYNLNWLSATVFSSATTSNMSTTLTYLSFMPLFMSLALCMPLSLLMYLMW